MQQGRRSDECLALPTIAVNVTRDPKNQTKNGNAKNHEYAMQ